MLKKNMLISIDTRTSWYDPGQFNDLDLSVTFAGWDREGDGDPGEASEGCEQTEGRGQEYPRADGSTRGHA